ncbi:hypothetical protein VYU27_002424 [Nannochloropsis oceanica]
MATKPSPQPLLQLFTVQIEAFVSRHQAATDELEDIHMNACIDEAQACAERRTLSPFLPTTATDLATIFEALQIGPRHIIVDLGCGDGRPLIAAALLRGCRGLGVDISQECIDLARTIATEEGLRDKVKFFRLDLLDDQDKALRFLIAAVEAQMSETGGGEKVVIFLYIYPSLLERLVELVRRLACACQGEGRQKMVQVVTLAYHFRGPLTETVDLNQAGEGRIHVHRLNR